ncbi:nuclear pore complex protein NUP62 isoform X2 [Cucumis melo var. makuwa]|uniref:Nuclear pore complex protein NUP62 isoform X2 n=1 Tax=Cucumis melo var. makuwa TaxID=1194695 RepID=A0A5D3DN95_CUCMM|nr:nuclear pore complex protein NUP62 isoform X2 [Cucumis melo var. makuwa]
MDAVGTDTDRRFCRLSLIDFASEDDFLLPSPSCDLHDVNSLDITNEDDEHDKIRQSEAIDCSRIQERTDAFEQREDKAQLLPSSEPEGIRRNGKYNLRKSLAWDSAFFTSAGFLDPEELTSMIAPVGRNEKRVLPIISEDVQKSSDSISTLESEIMPLESIEGNLFEDMKDSSASSKLPDALQGPGRTIKQNSSQPRGGQAVGRLPSSSLSSKRPSLGHNPTATAKDGTISGTRPADRRDSVSLRTTAHRPTRISTSAKSGQKTSSDVSTSSSDKVGKSSSKDVRKKTECKALPSSGVQNTPSRVASKVTSPFGKSRLSSKFASGISPASSISEWSTESSSNSTLELRSNSPRVSLRSLSSKRISTDSEASHDGRNHPVGPHTQTTGLLSQSVKKASSQSSILPPASTKPSGLRLPSPKIGYFDGSKTSSPKSNLAVPGGTTKIGAGNVSTNGGESKIKPSKLQPARLLPKSATRANIHPTMNLKSHKSSATKMSKTNALDQKVKELHREGSNTDLHGSDACAESKDISGATREELTKENESFSNANETVATNSQGEPNNTSPDF